MAKIKFKIRAKLMDTMDIEFFGWWSSALAAAEELAAARAQAMHFVFDYGTSGSSCWSVETLFGFEIERPIYGSGPGRNSSGDNRGYAVCRPSGMLKASGEAGCYGTVNAHGLEIWQMGAEGD